MLRFPVQLELNRGTPKQLFHLALDLGEDTNLIAGVSTDATIRNQSIALTGIDLLGVLDNYRTSTTAQLFTRIADNDADGLPNSFEVNYALDPDSPKDAKSDLDGDGRSNLDEYIAGTDPTDVHDKFALVDIQDGPEDIEIGWPSITGRAYKVQWSLDLITWNDASTHQGNGNQLLANLSKAAIDADDGVTGNLIRVFVRVEVFIP